MSKYRRHRKYRERIYRVIDHSSSQVRLDDVAYKRRPFTCDRIYLDLYYEPLNRLEVAVLFGEATDE